MKDNTISEDTASKAPSMDAMNSTEQSAPESLKKRSKSLKFLVIGLAVFSIGVLVSLVAGVVYAMNSDKNIPIISDIADAVENIAISDDKQVEMVQENMVDAVFASLIPIAEDKENNAFFKTNITRQELESMISNKKDLNSVRYEIKFDYVADKSGSFTLNASGFTKKRNNEYKYDSNTVFDGRFKARGLGLSGKGEMRQINNFYYLKFSELPAMVESGGNLKNKWIKFDTKEFADLAEQNNSQVQSTELTKEDLEKIENLIKSEEVKSTIKRIDSEVIKGVRTSCFQMDLDKDSLPSILNKANDIFDINQEKVYSEDLEELEYLKIVMCSDKKHNNLYKLALETKITPNDGNGESIFLTLDTKLWDYNKVNDQIEEPKDYVDFEDLLN